MGNPPFLTEVISRIRPLLNMLHWCEALAGAVPGYPIQSPQVKSATSGYIRPCNPLHGPISAASSDVPAYPRDDPASVGSRCVHRVRG